MALNRQSGRSGSTTFSEQPRALLLPQEVKEIGNDNALIFYEGLRPIRCKKIRYYADRRFRARLLPPPRHATPVPRKSTPVAPHAPVTTAASASAPAPAEPVTAEPSIAMHVAGVKDIEHLDSLKLEDLSAPLQNLTFEHAGERPTESELDADVNHFIDAIR